MKSITYIAFLRALNVGGRNIVKMDRLRELFTELGFQSVRTYIQSGNVFFEAAENDKEKLTKKIEAHLFKALGYEVTTFVRTIPEVEHALEIAPFKTMTPTDDSRFCIVFFNQPIDPSLTFPQLSSKQDIEILGVNKNDAYVTWHIINGRPPSSGTFIDKILGPSTSRFHHTTLKILEAAKAN